MACDFPACWTCSKTTKCKECNFDFGCSDYCEQHSPTIQFHNLFPHVQFPETVSMFLRKFTCYDRMMEKLFTIPCRNIQDSGATINICKAIMQIISKCTRYREDEISEKYIYDKLAHLIEKTQYLFLMISAGQRILFINNLIRCLMNVSEEIAFELIRCWILLCENYFIIWPFLNILCQITWKDSTLLSNMIKPILRIKDLDARGIVIYIYFGFKNEDQNNEKLRLLIHVVKKKIDATTQNTKQNFFQLLLKLNNLPFFLTLMQPFTQLSYSSKYWCGRFYNVLLITNQNTMKKIVDILVKYESNGSTFEKKNLASSRNLLLQHLLLKKNDFILFDQLKLIFPNAIINLILQYDKFCDFHMLKYELKHP